jgi:hypothetical protein
MIHVPLSPIMLWNNHHDHWLLIAFGGRNRL